MQTETPPLVGIEVTAETTFSDYCRWEGQDKLSLFTAWLRDLEDVGADIDSSFYNDYSCGVNFTVTIRQAWELTVNHGWVWGEEEEPPYPHIAGRLLEATCLDFDDPEIIATAERIGTLWDQWDIEKETASAAPPG